MTRVLVPQGLFTRHVMERRRPVTKAQLKRAQQTLGVRLPVAYCAVLRVRNGGSLRLPRVDFKRRPPRSKWSGECYGLGSLDGVYGKGGYDMIRGTVWARGWGVPELMFPFAGDGHWHCCLDYRKCGPRGEPCITHIEALDKIQFKVANSFAELLAGLYRTEEEFEPAIIAMGKSAPRGKRLDEALRLLGARTHSDGRANPEYPRPPTWTWKKYRGLLANAPAWITVERNRIYRTSFPKVTRLADETRVLTVSVTPTDEENCLAELLEAMGSGSKVVRRVG